MDTKIRKKDRLPLIVFALLTILMIVISISLKSKKILIVSAVIYYVVSNVIIAYRKWIRPDNIIINFIVLFFCWLFTWLFLKNIIGYGFMKWLLIFNYVLYILNTVFIIYGFIKRKRRNIVHYISLIWFLLTTIVISYILYIYVFNFIFMLSF